MLFQAIRKSLEFPQTSPSVQQNYIDFLAKTYRLSHNGDHGLEHWMRVLINGRLLAEGNGADIEVVEHFALIHDVMREDEEANMISKEDALKNAPDANSDYFRVPKFGKKA